MKTSHWPLTTLNTLVALLQLFLPLVLVRIFPQESIGAYKIFFLYLGILPLLSFSAGLTHGLAFWSGSAQLRGRLFKQVWTLLMTLSLVLMLGGLALQGPISSLFDGSGRQAFLFVISGVFALGIGFAEEAWVAAGRVWQTAIFRAVSEIVRTALIVYIAAETRSIGLVFVVHAAVSGVKWLIAAGVSYRQQAAGIVWDRRAVREILRYAVPVSLAGFLSAIANYADQILLSQLLSKAEFAVFAIGCLSVPPLAALEQSVNQVLTPRLSRALADGDKTAAAGYYAEAVYELGRFMIPAFAGLLVFAEPIIRILFTADYLEAAPVLRLYACSYLLLSIPYDGGPKASGNGSWALKTFLVKTLISIAMVVLLIRPLGVFGAMGGVLLSGVYLRAAGLAFNVKMLGWPYRRFLPVRRILKAAAAALVLGLASCLGRPLFADDRWWFFVCGGLFFAIYSSLFLLPRNKIFGRLSL